jgi:hypothetical protein
MNQILRKLSSRKLWLALAGIATGIAMVLGANSNDISTVAGAMTAIASVATYIITEGKIDAEGVKNAIIEIQDGIETIEGADGDA